MSTLPMKPITRVRRKIRKSAEIKIRQGIKGRIGKRGTALFMLVEQRGSAIETGKYKSIAEATPRGEARIAVDDQLLFKAREAGVTHVVVTFEDIGHLFVAALKDFYDNDYSRQRTARNRRMARMIDIRRCGYVSIAR